MGRGDRVNHLLLIEDEVITERLIVSEQIDHVGLGKGGEEQTELDFMIAVIRTEQGIEALVAHHGIIRRFVIIGKRLAFFLLQFLDPLLNIGFKFIAFEFAVWVRLPGKGKLWGSFIAIDQAGVLIEEWRRMIDMGMQGLSMGLSMAIALRVAIGGRPGDGQGAIITLIMDVALKRHALIRMDYP